MNEVPAGVHLRRSRRTARRHERRRARRPAGAGPHGYFPLSFQGRWSAQGFVQYPGSPAVKFGDAEIRLVDLDGDGVVDALRRAWTSSSSSTTRCKGWGPRRRAAPAAREFPDLHFSDPRVKLADLTGDNLQDFVLVEQGQIDYWPYLGHGHWGRGSVWSKARCFRMPSRCRAAA